MLRNKQTAHQSNEIATLMRMTQLIACGKVVDVVNTKITMDVLQSVTHYLVKMPPHMMGTKSSLLKVLLKETNVIPVHNLPETGLNTAVLRHFIRNWSFTKNENFSRMFPLVP